MTGVGQIGGVLLDDTSLFKEELIDAFFNFIDILIMKDRNLDDISWQLVQLNLFLKVSLVKQDDTIAVLTYLQQLAVLVCQRFAGIKN